MLAFAILTGIFSYSVFALGIFGLLYKSNLIILILIFFIILGFVYRKYLILFKKTNLINFLDSSLIFFNKNKLSTLFLILILIQLSINLIGTLGPELAFDALWYHLTLPKIYLLNHKLLFIPGGLFYYSAMPKLAEMLYVPMLALGSQIYPKLLHFFFGLLSILVVYRISRLYLSKKISIITCAIFISSLSFDWLQITAYIDLFRTFYEGLSFFYLLKFVKNKNKNDLLKTGILIGFAIATKLISLFDLSFINLFLIIFFLKEKHYSNETFLYKIKDLIIFNLISIVIPLPWFMFSYLNTNSFIYPFLSKIYPNNFSFKILDPMYFIKITWDIFSNSSDPLSPMFLIFIPIVLFSIRKFKKGKFYLILLSILIYLAWYLTPLTGGGRFILPFTIIFSVICGLIIDLYQISFLTIHT